MKYRRPLIVGLIALLLHFGCEDEEGEGEDEYKEMFLPVAVREATAIYSPDIDLVRKIFDRLNIVHSQHGYVTVKRINDQMSRRPEKYLQGLDVNPSDAVSFMENQYPTTRVATKQLRVPHFHLNPNESETWILHGIREMDRESNDM